MVSFGDSVASGEGNPATTRPKWEGDPDCHRSIVAGPRQAAEEIARHVPHEAVTFLHLACTGAWIDGVSAPQALGQHPAILSRLGIPGVSQLKQYKLLAPTHDGPPIVLLSVGANDVGFGSILKFCLLHQTCWKKQFAGMSLGALVNQRFRALERSYARLAAKPPFRGGLVFLTEYFDPLHNERGETCTIPRLFPFITAQEADWSDAKIVIPLNRLLKQQAIDWGWHLVGGIAKDFRAHGYCAKQSWIVHFTRAALGRDIKGAFHPNRLGQDDYARHIFQSVEPFLPDASP